MTIIPKIRLKNSENNQQKDILWIALIKNCTRIFEINENCSIFEGKKKTENQIFIEFFECDYSDEGSECNGALKE